MFVKARRLSERPGQIVIRVFWPRLTRAALDEVDGSFNTPLSPVVRTYRHVRKRQPRIIVRTVVRTPRPVGDANQC